MNETKKKNARRSEKGSVRLDPAKWERLMTAVLLVLAVVLGWRPDDRTVWYVEMVWVVGLWAILFFTRRIFLFSTAAYFCFTTWMILQTVGAHYTFEHVPMDWLTKPLGLVRNPYDRIAHFAVGWFAFPLAELFHRKGWTRSLGLAAFLAVALTVALAWMRELAEWVYTVVDGGGASVAFLGSRGDEWDAQKDILCDTLGALCASSAFLWCVNRNPRYWMRATRTSAGTWEHVEDRIAHILLAVFLWPMMFGCIIGFLVLERVGVLSRWWVGVLLTFAAFNLGKGTGIFREWPPKGWWKYESSARRSQKQRDRAKEIADGKT